jgi:hypothetical protein
VRLAPEDLAGRVGAHGFRCQGFQDLTEALYLALFTLEPAA